MGERGKPGETASAGEVAERFEQAMVDADIESLPRSKEIEAQIAEWTREGLSDEEQIRRLKRFFSIGQSEETAAE